MTLAEILSDHTLRNAALGAALLGLVSGVLGCFAVLRRQSMVGDTLAHAALPGICLGFMATGLREPAPILGGALVSGALAALTVLGLTRWTRLKSDAAMGIALSLFFAFGVVLLTHLQAGADAAQAGLGSFLFGQAAAVLDADLKVMAAVAAVALGTVALLWKEFKLVAFDPVFARTIGLPVGLLEVVLTVIVALAVVIGLQMVGVVLMASMVIAPAAAARQWVRTLGGMVLLAAGFGMAAGLTGALISALAPGLATGPLVVLAASALVLVSILFAPGRGVVSELLRRRAARRALPARRVLATLDALARDHDDPHYPAEQGMIDALHGGPTAARLADLGARGLVAEASHIPGEGRHWVLTDDGRAALAGREPAGERS